jgi:nucleoredoxin
MSASALTTLLGDQLHTHNGAVSVSDLASDYVALYFSASWCGPCRRFTPKLVKIYDDFSKRRPGELDVVLVSSDRSEKDAKSYHADMPWKMLPYEEQTRRTQLASMFKVRLIQHVVARHDGMLMCDRAVL